MEELKINDIEIRGIDVLNQIVDLNKQGRHVIFAPNHISPHSKVKTQLAMAEDYPKLKAVLQEYGLDTSILFRGDGDMEVGDSTVRKAAYDIHRKIFTLIGRMVSGGVPLNINAKEPKLAQQNNIGNVKEVLQRLKEQNMVIYPYGNWFKAGEQSFDEDLVKDGFTQISNFDEWRKSLKSGFIRFAKMSGAVIVPVYVDNTNGEWKISFEPIIDAPKDASNEELGQKYLETMRQAKAKYFLPEKTSE